MNTKERAKVQRMLADARAKAQKGGAMKPEYYVGFCQALEWVLVEA